MVGVKEVDEFYKNLSGDNLHFMKLLQEKDILIAKLKEEIKQDNKTLKSLDKAYWEMIDKDSEKEQQIEQLKDDREELLVTLLDKTKKVELEKKYNQLLCDGQGELELQIEQLKSTLDEIVELVKNNSYDNVLPNLIQKALPRHEGKE